MTKEHAIEIPIEGKRSIKGKDKDNINTNNRKHENNVQNHTFIFGNEVIIKLKRKSSQHKRIEWLLIQQEEHMKRAARSERISCSLIN